MTIIFEQGYNMPMQLDEVTCFKIKCQWPDHAVLYKISQLAPSSTHNIHDGAVTSPSSEMDELSVHSERPFFRGFREIFQKVPFCKHETRNFAK